MNKLRYFRQLIVLGLVSFLVWGFLTSTFIPGCYDSIYIRMRVGIFGVLIFAGSYLFGWIRKYIENLTYVWGVMVFIFYVYMCNQDIDPTTKFHQVLGLFAIGPVITIVIISRPFLFLWAFGISAFSIFEALQNYGNGQFFLFWLNMLTMTVLACFFSFQRIEGIEKLEGAMAEDRRKSDQMRKLYDFAAQAAHDIRSPVTALEMVVRTFDHDNPVRSLVTGSIQRINGIAESMLAMHRTGIKCSNSNRSEVADFKKIFYDLQAEYQLRHLHVKILINLGEGVSEFYSLKETDLYSIVSNLINNSIEAGATSISLSCFCKNDRINVTVSDNGSGVPLDKQADLFKRGFTFGKRSGNGLGLYGAKQCLQSIGGDISVRSTPGIGTEVSFWFRN